MRNWSYETCEVLCLELCLGRSSAISKYQGHSSQTKTKSIFRPGQLSNPTDDSRRDDTRSQYGEKYLWVDSLCIVQDDADIKHVQIQNMDMIYRSAFAVIVAAYGGNAHAGLPGVRPGSRQWTQNVEDLQGIKLANTHYDPTIIESTHNSRAWTYQEFLLARRVAKALWFRSEYGLFLEDRVEDTRSIISENPSGPFRQLVEMGYEPSHDYGLNFQRYALAVKRYTDRELTDEDDAVNALTGILNTLRPASEGDSSRVCQPQNLMLLYFGYLRASHESDSSKA